MVWAFDIEPFLCKSSEFFLKCLSSGLFPDMGRKTVYEPYKINRHIRKVYNSKAFPTICSIPASNGICKLYLKTTWTYKRSWTLTIFITYYVFPQLQEIVSWGTSFLRNWEHRRCLFIWNRKCFQKFKRPLYETCYSSLKTHHLRTTIRNNTPKLGT